MPMPHYFVTMDIEPANPLLPVDKLASIVRAAVLPTVEALVPLSAQGTLVTGGYLVGGRSMMFVFEAESEEEVREALEGLPLTGLATTDVKEMRTLKRLAIALG